MSIDKQYNQFAKDFSDSVSHPLISRNVFYKTLGTDLLGKTLLDVACGDGVDMLYYKKLGAIVSGVDASEELIDIAKSKLQENDIKVGLIEDLPFENDSFDIVVSKYAIQTSENIEKSLFEISRVAKSGALVIFLVTHPIRQFLEKKSKFRDYYKQEKVGSVLFKGDIVAEEPSHTISEYFSERFLEKMKLISFIEGSDFSDTSAQQVSGDYYPTFMICKLIKD